ncbi:MAG: restriction endonuclease [Granulosicoccus sp.]
MSQSSLFAVLLRSPWWYSVLIGVAVIAMSAVIFDGKYVALGVFTSLPFLGIAGFAGYKQAKQPGKKRILEVAEQARKMPATQIAEKVASSYREARFDSVAFKGSAAELELSRGHLKLLLCSKRFKAANTGIDPLKQLVAAGERVEATGYLYVTLGEVSEAARSYASQHNIEIIQATRLTAFFDNKAGIDQI